MILSRLRFEPPEYVLSRFTGHTWSNIIEIGKQRECSSKRFSFSRRESSIRKVVLARELFWFTVFRTIEPGRSRVLEHARFLQDVPIHQNHKDVAFFSINVLGCRHQASAEGSRIPEDVDFILSGDLGRCWTKICALSGVEMKIKIGNCSLTSRKSLRQSDTSISFRPSATHTPCQALHSRYGKDIALPSSITERFSCIDISCRLPDGDCLSQCCCHGILFMPEGQMENKNRSLAGRRPVIRTSG